MPSDDVQKVTVLLPKALVREAMDISQTGLTPTIRQGLEAVITNNAYQRVRALRGSVKLDLKLEELRRD